MLDIKPKSYEVRHPEGSPPHPKFDTWKEALAAQKEWNKEVPGHKAKKIQLPIISCQGLLDSWRR